MASPEVRLSVFSCFFLMLVYGGWGGGWWCVYVCVVVGGGWEEEEEGGWMVCGVCVCVCERGKSFRSMPTNTIYRPAEYHILQQVQNRTYSTPSWFAKEMVGAKRPPISASEPGRCRIESGLHALQMLVSRKA